MKPTPEQLKLVAEAMGYKVYIDDTCVCIKYTLEELHGKCFEFNPITDAEQDRELEVKFKITTSYHDGKWYAAVIADGYRFNASGSTPSEARLQVVINLLENE